MRSPSANAGDPDINPVMEPSAFFFHRDIDGTPRGAFFGGMGLDGLGDSDFAAVSSSFDAPPRPNREKVARGFASMGCDFLEGARFATAFGAVLAFICFVREIVEPGFAPDIPLKAAAIFAFLAAASALRK